MAGTCHFGLYSAMIVHLFPVKVQSTQILIRDAPINQPLIFILQYSVISDRLVVSKKPNQMGQLDDAKLDLIYP